MMRVFGSMLLSLGLFGMMGCSSDELESPTPTGSGDCQSPCQAVTTEGGHFSLQVSPEPSPIVAGDGSFRITVFDASDAPVTAATVSVEGYMDMGGGMGHGFPDPAVVTEQGEGVYLADVVYSMSGAWTVTFTVEKEGTADSVTLDVMVE